MTGVMNTRCAAIFLVLFTAGLFFIPVVMRPRRSRAVPCVGNVYDTGVNLPTFKHVKVEETVLHGRFRRSVSLPEPLINEVSPVLGLYKWDQKTAARRLLQDSRLNDWCRRPDDLITGQEGSPIEDYKLSTAIVLVTPGHINEFVGNNENCKWHQYISPLQDDKISSYEEVLSIYKNSKINKGGFKIYNAQLPNGTCRGGELTPLGITQHIRLGEYIRKAYFSDLTTLKLLSRKSVPLASCVQHPSAYQSTLAFLHGLFSEKQFIGIGIRKAQDNLCNDQNGFSCNCAKLESHQDFISNTKLHFGKHSKRFNTEKYIKHLYTSLTNLCQSSRELCSDKDCSQINPFFKMADQNLSNVTNSGEFISNARVYSHPFLTNLINSIFKPKRDFEVYTIKHFTFINILAALGMPVSSLPPPSSRIAIEVHEKSSFDKVLRILVNGKDVTPHLTICAHSFTSRCDLQNLKKIHNFDYKLECNR